MNGDLRDVDSDGYDAEIVGGDDCDDDVLSYRWPFASFRNASYGFHVTRKLPVSECDILWLNSDDIEASGIKLSGRRIIHFDTVTGSDNIKQLFRTAQREV